MRMELSRKMGRKTDRSLIDVVKEDMALGGARDEVGGLKEADDWLWPPLKQMPKRTGRGKSRVFILTLNQFLCKVQEENSQRKESVLNSCPWSGITSNLSHRVRGSERESRNALSCGCVKIYHGKLPLIFVSRMFFVPALED